MHKNLLKPTRIFFILFMIISTQSCKVYDPHSVTEVVAIESEKKVEVITNDGNTYRFEKLIVIENQLVGISKPNSKASKVYPSEKFIDSKGHKKEKVTIDRATIKEINVYDKKKSSRKTIWLAVGLTLGIAIFLTAAVATVAVVAY